MGVPTSDVDNNTELGSQALCSGNLAAALDYFTKAYEHSLDLQHDFSIRVCAFNLGAAYVALRQPREGLPLLQKAVPPPSAPDSSCNGDLFFNFGLAYELIPALSEAIKYYELSLEEYKIHGIETGMQAMVACKLGNLYEHTKSPLQAARVYGIAAVVHGKDRLMEKQLLCLCHQARVLVTAKKMEDALGVADDCIILCQRISPDSGILGISSFILAFTSFVTILLIVMLQI